MSNKILIFAGSSDAKILIEKINNFYLNLGEFHIIYEKDEIKEHFKEKENLYFFKIDFYAYDLYKNIIYQEFNKIFVLEKNRHTAQFLAEKLNPLSTPISFVKYWDEFEIEMKNNIEIIDLPEIVANKFIDLIPGVPVFARDIGLGIGEILEVEIPPHSPYIYKKPAILNNKEVKVAAIYRNNRLVLINKKTIILPNDKILIIGNPRALKEVFNKIKQNIGAFPQPYGQNIYLLIDMRGMDRKEISKLLKASIYFHRKLKNKRLIIRVINPKPNTQITKLHKFINIDIYTEYFETDYKKMLLRDLEEFNIGLIVTNSEKFIKYQTTFLNTKLPIFKSGNSSVKKCEALKIILDEDLPKIASNIFDLAFQLNLKLEFIEFEKDYSELIEYLNTFVKEYNFKVDFKKSEINPIKYLEKLENFCLVSPFLKVTSKWKQIINPDIQGSFIMLLEKNQFLLPVKEEDESNS